MTAPAVSAIIPLRFPGDCARQMLVQPMTIIKRNTPCRTLENMDYSLNIRCLLESFIEGRICSGDEEYDRQRLYRQRQQAVFSQIQMLTLQSRPGYPRNEIY